MLKKSFAFIILSAVILLSAPIAVYSEAPINLVSGLSYTVETGEPVTHSHANFSENGVKYDVDKGQLTDSRTALTSESSEGWYRSFRAESRLVAFDLGDTYAISGVRAGFLNAKDYGIYAPRYINVYLSHDGENYTQVYNYLNTYPIHDSTIARNDIEFELDKLYASRYVKIEFCSDIFCYCDEIEVLGYKELTGNESDFADAAPATDPGFLGALDGVSNIIKIYNGYYPPDQSKALLTPEILLPYVAYLGQNGEIAGTMFDAVAFVPCHGDYPSGGRLVKTNGKPGAVMSDWELYFDMTFSKDYDLSALDETVGKVYSELGIDKKYKVFLTMPYPTVIDAPFGDIDGDGKDEYCVTFDDRFAICRWYAEKCIDAFREAGYENLELAGFYWYREEVNYSNSDHEAELVSAVNRFIQSRKLLTLFDPFYLSIGYDHWESLGFSGAVMQPNVAFTSNYDYFEIDMLGEFAQSASRHHLGVEIETNEPSAFSGDQYLDAGRNYESYLYYGYKTGYMSALKTYYQGAGPGTFYNLCYADVATPKGVYLRRLYDLTHSFIDGTYSNLPPTVSVSDFEAVSGVHRNVVDISITDDDSYWGDITIEFPVSPEHGYIAAAAGKRTLVYSADEDYVGEDSFTVVVSDGFNRSEEITVTVTVSAPTPADDSSIAESMAESASPGDNTENAPIWLIAVIIVLVLAVVAVATVLIVKRVRKK